MEHRPEHLLWSRAFGPFTRLSCLAHILLGCLLLSSCSLYRRNVRPIDNVIPLDDLQQFTLAHVEIDDLGWYLDRAKADKVLKLIGDRATVGNLIVIVFIHG